MLIMLKNKIIDISYDRDVRAGGPPAKTFQRRFGYSVFQNISLEVELHSIRDLFQDKYGKGHDRQNKT